MRRARGEAAARRVPARRGLGAAAGPLAAAGDRRLAPRLGSLARRLRP